MHYYYDFGVFESLLDTILLILYFSFQIVNIVDFIEFLYYIRFLFFYFVNILSDFLCCVDIVLLVRICVNIR